MRVFLGMILGMMLTISVAFIHDNWTTEPSSTTGSSTRTLAQRNMVNWDVVDDNWRTVRQRAQETWTTLTQKISS